jgi:hypothetical protein
MISNEDMDTGVAGHEIVDHLVEVYDVGAHEKRKGESSDFRASVARLRADGHHQCFVCGVKRLAEIFDVYGYGRLLQNIPISTVDDIRNCMNLCAVHHIERVTGIHTTTFSAWVSQCLGREGVEIVPQDRAVIERLIDAKQILARDIS